MNFLNERMRRQEICEAATERTGSMAVNNTNAREIGERSVIQEFFHTARSFFHGTADHVDFIHRRFVTRLCVHRNAP